MELIEPKDVEIPLQRGGSKTFVLSKFPATVGREIICKYPLSGMPKLGDYAVNEATMYKLYNYVAVRNPDGSMLRLSNAALVDNHVPDWEALVKIEMAMLEYNTSFFQNGKVSGFLDKIAQNIPQLITKILMDFSAQSSQTAKQHITNSGQSTR